MTLEIETRNLRLRPWTLDDIDELHRLWTDPEVRKYLWDDEVITREQAAEAVQSSIDCFRDHGFGQWLMTFRDDRAIVGFCGFRLFGQPPEIEILYGLAPEHWGKGLATEAAQAMLRLGFEELGFDRIYAGADPPNAASFRVMERIGMKFKKRTTVNGLDAVYYSIARNQFRPDAAPYALRRN